MSWVYAKDGVDTFVFDFENLLPPVPAPLPPLGTETVPTGTTHHHTHKTHAVEKQQYTQKTICKYWYADRCRKGDTCEFMHTMNDQYMPVCNFGIKCERRSTCPYRHIDQQQTVKECSDYNLGFCPRGPKCMRLHIKRPPSDLPDPQTVIRDVEEQCRQRSQKHFTKLCDQWMRLGTCHLNTKCTYAHGYHRLCTPLLENKIYKNPEGEVVLKNGKWRYVRTGKRVK